MVLKPRFRDADRRQLKADKVEQERDAAAVGG